MEAEKRYGLRVKKTGKLLGFCSQVNHGEDCCVDVSYYLTETPMEEPWLVMSAVHAEFVARRPTYWFNARYETPHHGFNAEDLEVVEITTTTTSVPMALDNLTECNWWEYCRVHKISWEGMRSLRTKC